MFLLSEFLVGNRPRHPPTRQSWELKTEEVANEIAAIIKSGAGRIMSTAKTLHQRVFQKDINLLRHIIELQEAESKPVVNPQT